jgi:hypothetical protein
LRRPDLLAEANLTEVEKVFLEEVLKGRSIDDCACLPDRQGIGMKDKNEF